MGHLPASVVGKYMCENFRQVAGTVSKRKNYALVLRSWVSQKGSGKARLCHFGSGRGCCCSEAPGSPQNNDVLSRKNRSVVLSPCNRASSTPCVAISERTRCGYKPESGKPSQRRDFRDLAAGKARTIVRQ